MGTHRSAVSDARRAVLVAEEARLREVAADVDAHPSQRREARELLPVISALLAGMPRLRAVR